MEQVEVLCDPLAARPHKQIRQRREASRQADQSLLPALKSLMSASMFVILPSCPFPGSWITCTSSDVSRCLVLRAFVLTLVRSDCTSLRMRSWMSARSACASVEMWPSVIVHLANGNQAQHVVGPAPALGACQIVGGWSVRDRLSEY